jgi:hypothetical protein
MKAAHASCATSVRPGQVRRSADGQSAICMSPLDRLLQVLLDVREVERRQITSVRVVIQTLGLAAHTDEVFDVVVPGGEVRIFNWPPEAVTIGCIGREIHRGKPRTVSTPGQRFASELIAANPVELGALLDLVGLFHVLHVVLLSVLRQS